MEERTKVGVRVSRNTIIGNAVLGTGKVLAGIVAKSNAMLADGIHSFSDVITTIGVIIGLKLSSRPDDEDHPYGHEKIESIASLFLAITLLGVALGIGYSGLKSILNGKYNEPGFIAILAAIVSIIVKEWMYHYTMKYAKESNSASLKADAWHHRSDSLSSIGALIGIIGARHGFPILDPIGAIVICIIIVKVSIDIMRETINELIDSSASKEVVKEILDKLKEIKDIKRIDSVKTRKHASKIYVDVEVSVNSNLTVEEGHTIALAIHNSVEKNQDVKHCMVHINPI